MNVISEDYDVFQKEQIEVEEAKKNSNVAINIVSMLVTLIGMGLVGLANLGLLGTATGMENLSLTVGVTLTILGVIGLSFGVSGND